jgi:hypothetical protein
LTLEPSSMSSRTTNSRLLREARHRLLHLKGRLLVVNMEMSWVLSLGLLSQEMSWEDLSDTSPPISRDKKSVCQRQSWLIGPTLSSLGKFSSFRGMSFTFICWFLLLSLNCVSDLEFCTIIPITQI